MKSTNAGAAMEVESPISNQVAERLASEKKGYAKAYQEFVSNFDYDDGLKYYIISAKFIIEWKKYTAYDETNLNIKPSTGTPPEPYNKNLLTKHSAKAASIKEGLLEGKDYEIISPAMMEVFKNYEGVSIEKQAFKLSNGKKIVEIYGLEFTYFFLSQLIVSNIDLKKDKLQVEKSEVSRYMSVRDFKKALVKAFEQSFKEGSAKDVRIWKMNSNMTPQAYSDYIKKQAQPQRQPYKLKIAHATLFEKADSIIDDIAIATDDCLIIEVLETNKEWVISEGMNQNKCQFCRKYQVLNYECGCKKVKYCSTECQSKDLNYHRNRCNIAEEEEMKQQISFNFSNSSRRGVCGLSNLGNTCFMNSCLQCLSNTLPLTQYFVSKKFLAQINKNNPIGTKGKLTVKYAKMIQALWCLDSDTYSPYVLKNAISDFQPMFSGYNQHDSQQLLSFLLDGLHEDLNRVLNKPYVENIDYKGEPDEVYAFESWKRYLMRNKSIIVDTFMGQYKSKVVCPDCKFESLTFDPFSTVSLPIPQSTKIFIETYVFYSNYRQTPKKISINASVRSIKVWKEQVSKALSLDPQLIAFYILSFKGECEQFNSDTNLDRLITAYERRDEIFVVERSKQEQAEIKNSVLIYSKFVKTDDYSSTREPLTFKRPFYWKFNKLTGEQVYYRMFIFLWKISLNSYFKIAATDNQDTINKYFEKGFESLSRAPFHIYLMSDPVKSQRSDDIKYEKEVLIEMNTPVHSLLLDNNGQLRKIEFEVRLRKLEKEDTKKLNTYEDLQKYKKSKYEDEDSTEYQLTDCLQEFEKVEKLETGNEWRCPKCQDFKLAYKSMNLYKTPKILILHLKRFKQKSSYYKTKIGALVKFPLELDLNGYVINKTLPESYFKFQNPQANTKESTRYELYAVSNHFGGMGGGHYTAYAKNNGDWYDYNDSSVHKIKSSEVVSSSAYMLFYRRID